MHEKLIALLDHATEKFHFDAWENTDKIADFLIANGVTVSTGTNVGSKWIPAVEQLPKEDGSYLVRTTTGTVTTARFYAFKSFPATKYLPATHRNPAWQSNRNVTHWMPLPEPPREGKP